MAGMMGMSPGHPPPGAAPGQMMGGFHPGSTPPGRSPMPSPMHHAMMGMGSPHHHHLPHPHHGLPPHHGMSPHHVGTPPHPMAAVAAAAAAAGMSPGHHGGMMMPGGIPGGGPHHSPHHMAQSVASPAAAAMQHQQQDKDATQVSSLPLPPSHYVDLYTDASVASSSAPRPPPPLTDTYSMFGAPFNASDDATIVQTLESQGIRRLYPAKDVDRKRELQKLNQSVLVNFLDLLDILIRAPESPKRDEKIDDLNLLFIHMHHLINEFRPHQARETLRVMLHVQRRKRLQVANSFQQHLDKVQETIEEALRSLPEQNESEEKMLISRRPQLNQNPRSSRSASDEAMVLATGAGGGLDMQGSCAGADKLFCQMADGTQTQAQPGEEKGEQQGSAEG